MKFPRIRLLNVVLTSIAVAICAITLAGYFLLDVDASFLLLRLQLIAWGSVLAAVAVWLGAWNLLRVHFKKLLTRSPGWAYSPFVLLGAVGVVVAALLPLSFDVDSPYRPLSSPYHRLVFEHLITATGGAIAALLAFVLALAGFRMLRRPLNLTSAVFLGTAIVALMGMAPTMAGMPDGGWLRDVWTWLSQVPGVAGARGLMLGIALGIIATGLRVLLALDRPYGD
jgi:hypothetical protein